MAKKKARKTPKKASRKGGRSKSKRRKKGKKSKGHVPIGILKTRYRKLGSIIFTRTGKVPSMSGKGE